MSKQLTIRMKGDAAEVLLYDVIGEDFWGGISAKTFREQVKAIKARTLSLRVNSPGGSVLEAAAMLQALDEFRGRIEVSIDGLAASAATLVMMAGDTISAATNALVMIHNPWAGAVGTADEMRRTADLLDKVREQILDRYAARGKLTREEFAAAMDAETWYTGKEAVDTGLVDGVTEPASAAAFAGLTPLLAKMKFRKMPELPQDAAPDPWAETERRREIARKLVAAVPAEPPPAEKPAAVTPPAGRQTDPDPAPAPKPAPAAVTTPAPAQADGQAITLLLKQPPPEDEYDIIPVRDPKTGLVERFEKRRRKG